MDVSGSTGFSARPVTFSADLAAYARTRAPLVARICIGPEPDEWERHEIDRTMIVKAEKIAALGTFVTNREERALASRYIREALWSVCDLILSTRSSELEGEPLDLAPSVSKAELRDMFPLVGEWLYGAFSEGQIARMRHALRIACEDMIRHDRKAAHLDAAGLRRLQRAHDDMERALLWTCATLVRG